MIYFFLWWWLITFYCYVLDLTTLASNNKKNYWRLTQYWQVRMMITVRMTAMFVHSCMYKYKLSHSMYYLTLPMSVWIPKLLVSNRRWRTTATWSWRQMQRIGRRGIVLSRRWQTSLDSSWIVVERSWMLSSPLMCIAVSKSPSSSW